MAPPRHEALGVAVGPQPHGETLPAGGATGPKDGPEPDDASVRFHQQPLVVAGDGALVVGAQLTAQVVVRDDDAPRSLGADLHPHGPKRLAKWRQLDLHGG